MNKQWKFQLGDIVQPIVQGDSGHGSKMVIIAKLTHEFANHTEYSYLCSDMHLGDIKRLNIFEEEIHMAPKTK
jgi:hypothetical protein